MKILEILQLIVLVPIGFAFFLVFVALWMIWTITGIGPVYQWYCASRDKNTLDTNRITSRDSRLRVISVPGDVHSCSMGKSYNLFAIFSTPIVETSFPPICIPNGLGANAVLISKLQESLVAAGFTVLSFDRFGVGLSDENVSGSFPTASDVVAEMEYVMSAVLHRDQKWILLGPSMGSIVAQCYIAQHPNKVVGFLNMDGLPYPFIQQKSAFAWAGFIYKMYASIVWTGILRPCIGMAGKDIQRMFGSRTFTLELILALMNQRRFFGNIALEMSTMMDCCAMAERAWGPQSLLKLPPRELEALVRAAPDESVCFTAITAGSSSSTSTPTAETRSLTQERSPSERGASWSAPEEVRDALAGIALRTGSGDPEHAHPAAVAVVVPPSRGLLESLADGTSSSGGDGAGVLGRVWRGLVVRVMSARNHDFGNAVANSFYTQEMRDMAAAEHAVHALCARNGARSVYPRITHAAMFTQTDEIVSKMRQIALAL